VGEAEETWPRFLADWAAGAPKGEYRQIEKIDMATSPPPRWEGLEKDLTKYAFGGVQTTRGCPFDCEFCDVIYLYGRRARHKPIPQVLDEVRTLERLGMRNVFFSDDEFIGDRKYAKDLLRELVALNATFTRPLTFSTQLTMNLSRDDELLALMADANFDLVFIGIETPNKESLRETHKIQNIREDLVADVHKILSYGISIRAGIIVGFDHDDETIFDTVFDFIQDAYLPSLAINMLKAPLGTRLWSRLRLEGRVVSITAFAGKAHPRTYTNILPKKMTRAQLVRGYGDLLERVYAWPAFAHRVKGFVSVCQRAPRVREAPMTAEAAVRLPEVLDVSPEVRAIVADIVAHTMQHAPFLIRRVKRLVVQHAAYHATLARLLPQIARQVALENDEGLTLGPDDRAIPIPPGFRAVFPKIFPEVHRRVYLNLRDHAQVPEALTDVFVDFLVRWGDEFTDLEPHHRTFLAELCDRTCARMNGDAPEKFVPVEDETLPVPDVKRIRLGEDVLRSVDQELLRFVQARQATEARA
jgi:pyruvate-formate lyase-activating enzyme